MRAVAQKDVAGDTEIFGESDLPEGWVATTMGEVAEVVGGGTPRTSDPENFSDDGIPWVTPADLSGFKGTWIDRGKRGLTEKGLQSSSATLMPKGTVLMSSRAPIGYVAIAANPISTNQGFKSFVLPQGIISEFCLYWLKHIKPQLELMGSGTTFLEISGSRACEIPFSLAPTKEQKRIVAKVEELLKQVNASRERLAKVPRILKRFRQSVLAAACSGRLTEDWRERNPQAEDVSATVDAIRLRRLTGTKSPAQKEKLQEIYEYSEENDSSELPESWRFIALNKLCASFDYGTSAKSEPSGRVPVLRMGNIQSGKIDWSSLLYTSDGDEIKQYSLLPNSVLFNRTNSPELVGKTAIYRGERPAIFAGYLIRIVNLPELDPHYLNLCLNTNYAREFCSQVKTDGVSQSNINAQKLGTFEVPFCPLAEQHEIVRRAEGLFKLAETIEKRVAAATRRAEKLTQAILAKAFRGELVPTEAELARREGRTYEPASALLARIQSERASARNTRSPVGRSARNKKSDANE
jgi:type I restriction enzyme S subunit